MNDVNFHVWGFLFDVWFLPLFSFLPLVWFVFFFFGFVERVHIRRAAFLGGMGVYAVFDDAFLILLIYRILRYGFTISFLRIFNIERQGNLIGCPAFLLVDWT